MLNEDVLKEYIFECEIRKLSKRTIRSYRNANLRMMRYIEREYSITELEETHHQAIKGYIPKNPMDRVRKQKEPETIIETFNNMEVARMIKAFKGTKFLDIRNQLIMIMLFDTG